MTDVAEPHPEPGASNLRAVIPGSFDPITLGHLDLITRAATLFGEVWVAVAQNMAKQPWFDLDERRALAQDACRELANVRVDSFDGLLVEYAARRGCQVLVKGLRSVLDFDFEVLMARNNRQQAPTVETLFLVADARYAHVSSSIVRELALHGGDLSELVPPILIERLLQRAARVRHNPDRD